MEALKNALRTHFVAPWTSDTEVPSEADYMQLAHLISDIDDATNEEVEATGFYDGDGTPEEMVQSVAVGYDYSGFYDSTDPAQAFIAAMRHETGIARRCWQRVISADGEVTEEAPAVVTAIVAGAGAATEDETFECTIRYRRKPTITGLSLPSGNPSEE